MKIKGIKKEEVEIEVPEQDLINKFLELICKKLDLRKDAYVRDNKVFIEEIFCTGHRDIVREIPIMVSKEILEEYKLIQTIKEKLC